MRAHRLLHVRVSTLLLLLLLATGLVPALAEVGALRKEAPAPYVLGTVDDPEPFWSWERFTPTSVDSRAVLNEDGQSNGDGPPSVAYIAAERTPIVVWARNSPDGFDVVYSAFRDDAWTDPATLAGSPADELDPTVTVDPATGAVHVFYWVDDLNPRVMHREAPADLSSWSAPVQVSNAADPACRPSAVVHEGVPRVVYEVHSAGSGQTPLEIVLARWDEPSGQFIEEVMASTYHAGPVRPRVGSHAGRLWVDWIDAADEVAWIRLGSGGQWESTRYETYSGAWERDLRVRPGLRLRVVTVP